jgi:hypothetical protein
MGFIAATSLAWPQLLRAELQRPFPHPVGKPQSVGGGGGSPGPGSRWTPLVDQPTFLVNGAANPMLLTDGSVLVQDAGFRDWWKLTPDLQGSYVNGTWTQVASLPEGYSPLYHSSAVLPDGRLIIEGGEYLLSDDQSEFIPTWTAKGAIFDPVANTWTPVLPPPFFTGFGGDQTIGDAQGVVLPDGTYMQANCCTKETALLDARTLTWRSTGTSKATIHDEEGWTLLPSGKVLTVDAYVGSYDPNGTSSELYDPATGAWSPGGSTLVQLWDSASTCGGEDFASFEVGPGVLRPDGTVFYTGSNGCGASHTATYDARSGQWRTGPDFPDDLGVGDGPAALLPNGNVLMVASPGIFNLGARFFEWDGTALTEVPAPPNSPINSSFFGNMLVLPTGQILLTDFSNDIEIYSPDAAAPRLSPVITQAPSVIARGASFVVTGRRFNGMSQGAAYGDDVQAATNYPIVRITNLATGHVFYSRTHDHSSMAVASSAIVSTQFDVPAAQERGFSMLEVVANGVPSMPALVLVR